MARKTQPYVCDMSVHASVFYISCLVFSSTFADHSPYLNRIGVSPKTLFPFSPPQAEKKETFPLPKSTTYPL